MGKKEIFAGLFFLSATMLPAYSQISSQEQDQKPPQDLSPDTLSIDSRLVTLDVLVNQSPKNLQNKDFKVYENGELQEARIVGSSEEREADVVFLATSFNKSMEGISAVDDYYANVARSFNSFRDALNQTSMNHQVALTLFSRRLLVKRPLLSTKSSIYRPISGPELTDQRSANQAEVEWEPILPESLLTTLLELRCKSARLDRRKAVVLIAEERDFDSLGTGDSRLARAIENLLERSQITLYVIANKENQVVRKWVDLTGGKYFTTPLAEIESPIQEIGVRFQNMVSLAYEPLQDARDGEMRKIKIVTTAPLRASTRSAYRVESRTVRQATIKLSNQQKKAGSIAANSCLSFFEVLIADQYYNDIHAAVDRSKSTLNDLTRAIANHTTNQSIADDHMAMDSRLSNSDIIRKTIVYIFTNYSGSAVSYFENKFSKDGALATFTYLLHYLDYTEARSRSLLKPAQKNRLFEVFKNTLKDLSPAELSELMEAAQPSLIKGSYLKTSLLNHYEGATGKDAKLIRDFVEAYL